MEVFRLARKAFSKELSGKGAALKGARWNSVGVEAIYTATNRSLAMAEVAVHISLAMMPDDFMMITIHIPDDVAIQKLEVTQLPQNWNAFPPIPATQALGDTFIRSNTHCLLLVPSVVTKGDFNLIINPHHPRFSSIKIVNVEKFPFDGRLLK